ncbi:hypothetical protein C0Q70_13206 [Pomacea canaliculata]|uniref:Uncharacterized protein n=1 Tax=Pomacea canaliculata TaxID=400727 RepID=A0A2T7NWJ8_POMCA|nr:hypothetical protein C0Q70_13206 [Pomacea canaliculata]
MRFRLLITATVDHVEQESFNVELPATTQYPSYDTTYGYGTSSYPWNYETLLAGIPGKILQPIVPTKQLTTTIQIATTVPFSPYQTTDYDYSNSYYSTISPYQTSNSKNWNNYYTTNSPYQTSNSENWNNYYTTNSPYQTSNSDNWNNYYTTNSPYQTSNSDNWNNYYTTNSPYQTSNSENWNNYYTTNSPYQTSNSEIGIITTQPTVLGATKHHTMIGTTTTQPTAPGTMKTLTPGTAGIVMGSCSLPKKLKMNRISRYYWTTQSPNRYNQEGLLEALAVDVVAEAREVVSGAEETLEKANDLEDAVFRANGEEGPRSVYEA